MLRLLFDNAQHTQETDIRAIDAIRTRIPSKRVAADPHLRPQGHWHWPSVYFSIVVYLIHTLKYTKKTYCVTTCFNLHEISFYNYPLCIET